MPDVLPVVILVLLSISTFTANIFAGDWPMWRYDANRSASSPYELPGKLYLQWVREYPRLEPAWENPLNQDLMQYDKTYEPAVLGKTLFVGSNASDRLVALDTESGEEKWTFYTGGPLRLPAVAFNKKVYFVSDDGYLYCVDADQGKLIWKFRGGPSDRKILGNGRLVSAWPARGGPVLKDGVIYFAAGIWPFMGVFIHALDAESGKVLWSNDSSGSMYILQPHNSPAYGGVAPQGALVVAGNKLLVPCGRSVPACFDRHTGKFLYYRLGNYKKAGGAFVSAIGNWFINYHRDMVTSIYDLSTGDVLIARFGNIPVLTEETLFCMGESITAFDCGSMKGVEYDKKVKDKKTKEYKIVRATKWVIDKRWECEADSRGDLIKAGNRLYAGGKNIVSAIDIVPGGGKPVVSWREKINGTVSRIIAADDKLFVVTLEGRIHAFGGKRIQTKFHPGITQESARSIKDMTPLAESGIQEAMSILKATGADDGYCLAYGLGSGGLVEALARNSDLQIIAVDPDPAKVDRLRRRFDAAGLYGKKITVQVGDPFTFEAPPYLASLTVFENLEAAGYKEGKSFFKRIYHSMRPYGGVAYLPVDKSKVSTITRQIRKSSLPRARLRKCDGFLLLTREGALPGSADWTHQYRNIANTVKSDDKLVRLPLGVLWFGGNSNMDVLPRHGHGPMEQVAGGRLFIEGIDCLSARDVYTGRVLWKRTLPNLGTFDVYYDKTYKNTPLSTAYNQGHIPGANARGANFVVAADSVYVVQGSGCLVLDPATGATVGEVKLPKGMGADRPPEWGYIGVYRDYLIAGAGFARYTDFLQLSPKERKNPRIKWLDIASSKKLIVMNRHTGKVLWAFGSDLGLRHNAIAVGNDRIFCIDAVPSLVSKALKKRGKGLPGTPKLRALDVRTGNVIWSTVENIFGTWLGYSEEHDILLQAGRKSRDMVQGEPKGMAAYRGKDGTLLWRNDASYSGPCMLHGETIITDRHAYSLLTGKQKMRKNPLTGEEKPWAYLRKYGCGSAIASEYLLTFRSAAAGFYDLEHDGGTGNFGGFKSGCTSNLIAANGVLNAPDYTRTCSCSYQNQTSLAMIHMPEVEMWTFNDLKWEGKPVQQVGINLGAPGDRLAKNGTLWLDYPSIGGSSPDIPVKVVPEKATYFLHHASRITHGVLPWVTASGVKGAKELTITLAENEKNPRAYTVRLYFAEPEDLKAGQRLLRVSLNEKEVLKDFDIAQAAGGFNRTVVKEFKKVLVTDVLKISLAATKGRTILCGIEVRALLRKKRKR